MRRLRLACCLALVAAVAVVASAAAGSRDVPIKASLAIHADPTAPLVVCTPTLAGVAFPNLFVATGQMSHLGLVETDIHLASCSVGSTGVVMNGTADVIGANGDILHNPSWSLTLNPATGGFSFTQLVLDGGTGRFTDATGSLTGAGALNPDGTGSYTVEGLISNIGSTN